MRWSRSYKETCGRSERAQDTMTKQQAVQLQKDWASKSNPPCAHDTVKLLMTEDRTYLTGEYGCTACGAQITEERMDWVERIKRLSRNGS
jgi:hypothetical protein